MPVQGRSDFKQALSTLQQVKEKEEKAQRNQRWAQSSSSSSWWSWQGSWWTSFFLMKVTMEMNLIMATCYTIFWNTSSRHDFHEFFYIVTDGSFTADGGLL